MNRVLSVFDVSSFIHAGHVNKHSFLEQYIQKDVPGHTRQWCSQRTLSGGTAFLLKAAIRLVNHSDVVFCCDRNPTIKKSMLNGYKGNRDHKATIENDKRLAEIVLNSCDATVLSYDGYEADDIIYTVVRQCYDMYDEIHVYTGDSDMYFLVDEKVSIKPSSSRAKEVTMSNFSTSFKKGITIPYNLAIPYKILYGDTSDCIPGLPKDCHKEFIDLITRGKIPEMCGRKDALQLLCYELFPLARKSLDIIHPLDVDSVPYEFGKLNLQMMYNWADTMNCREYAGLCVPSFNAEQRIAEIQAMGLYEEE